MSDPFTLFERHINPGLASLLRFTGLDVVEDHAEGVYVWDTDGKRYLDFLSLYGTLSLGHRHPRVVEAVSRQLARQTMSTRVMISAPAARLAARLAEITPEGLSMSFFGNSGAEAVEAAFKLTRIYTGKPEIITMRRGFHGKTFGALSLTPKPEYQDAVRPLVPGVKVVPFGDAEALAQAITPKTAAVILEPVQGEGGVRVPPEGYLQAVRALTQERGVLMIADEVQTGLGRTGELWGVNHADVAPDLLTSAKALGGGVMPIGAVVGRPELFEVFKTSPLIHSSTFGGNPLAAAAALAAIETTLELGLPARARTLGEYFLEELRRLVAVYPDLVREVRGQGLLIGMEFIDADIGALVISEMAVHGVLTAFGLNDTRVVRLEPPLIVERSHIDEALSALADSLAATREVLIGVI